jgi:hypothetical protein
MLVYYIYIYIYMLNECVYRFILKQESEILHEVTRHLCITQIPIIAAAFNDHFLRIHTRMSGQHLLMLLTEVRRPSVRHFQWSQMLAKFRQMFENHILVPLICFHKKS